MNKNTFFIFSTVVIWTNSDKNKDNSPYIKTGMILKNGNNLVIKFEKIYKLYSYIHTLNKRTLVIILWKKHLKDFSTLNMPKNYIYH